MPSRRHIFFTAWAALTVFLLLSTPTGTHSVAALTHPITESRVIHVPVPVPVQVQSAAEPVVDKTVEVKEVHVLVPDTAGAKIRTPIPEPPRGPVPWDRKYEEVTDGDPNHRVSSYAAHRMADQVASHAREAQAKRHIKRLQSLGTMHARTLGCDGTVRAALPRFGIVSVQVSPPKHVANNAGATKPWMPPLSYYDKKYAERWGYDFHLVGNDVIKGHEDTPEIASFAKIMALKKWLPKYQWLVLLDMDLVITNMELSLETRLKGTTADHDIVMTKDWNGINSGVFFLRNSVYSNWFLDELRFGPREWAHPWADQSVMNALLDPRRNQALVDVFRPRFRWVSQQSINAFGINVPRDHPASNWQRGMFIVHFPNCKSREKVCRQKMAHAFVETSDHYKLDLPLDGPVPLKGGCWGPNCLRAE